MIALDAANRSLKISNKKCIVRKYIKCNVRTLAIKDSVQECRTKNLFSLLLVDSDASVNIIKLIICYLLQLVCYLLSVKAIVSIISNEGLIVLYID